MQCPKCQSDNVQRAEVIHSQGTSQISTTSSTAGVVSGSGGIGFGSASTRTRGTQQTNLARQMAPPGMAPMGIALAVAVIAMLLGMSLFDDKHPSYFGLMLWFATAIVAIVYAFSWKRNIRTPRLARWVKQWFCNKCGTTYLDADAPAAPKTFNTNMLALASVVLFCGSMAYTGSVVSATEEATRVAAVAKVHKQNAFVANAVLLKDLDEPIDYSHRLKVPAGTELHYIGPAKAGLYPKPRSMFRFKQADCDAHHFNCRTPLALSDDVWKRTDGSP